MKLQFTNYCSDSSIFFLLFVSLNAYATQDFAECAKALSLTKIAAEGANVRILLGDRIYSMNDPSNSSIKAKAEIKEERGVKRISFFFATRTQEEKGRVYRHPSIRGAEQFREAVNWLQTRNDVRGLIGHWTNGVSGWSDHPDTYQDNLIVFNELTDGRKSPEEAAAATWTGRQAAALGFSRIKIKKLVGKPGRYSEVVVYFDLPGKHLPKTIHNHEGQQNVDVDYSNDPSGVIHYNVIRHSENGLNFSLSYDSRSSSVEISPFNHMGDPDELSNHLKFFLKLLNNKPITCVRFSTLPSILNRWGLAKGVPLKEYAMKSAFGRVLQEKGFPHVQVTQNSNSDEIDENYVEVTFLFLR